MLGLETAHQVKVLDSTPEDVDLRLMAGTHMVEGRDATCKVASNLHVHNMEYPTK